MRAKWPFRPELIPGSVAWKGYEYFYYPLERDSSPSQGYPRHWIRRYSFLHRGGERRCESQVTCSRTQNNIPGQGSNPDYLDPE